jgi:hypothetical protein
MVQVLGDGPAQARIREGSTKPHCRILADNPSACLKCTLPENPYHPEKKPDWNRGMSAMAEQRMAFDHVLMWFHDMQSGLVGRRDRLSMPAEYAEVFRVCMQEWRLANRHAEADYLAAKLGEITAKLLAQMFAKK